MPDFDLDSALNPQPPEFPDGLLRQFLERRRGPDDVFGCSVHRNPEGHYFAFAEIGRSKRNSIVYTIAWWNPITETWHSLTLT